jgi:hypothetical protein
MFERAEPRKEGRYNERLHLSARCAGPQVNGRALCD